MDYLTDEGSAVSLDSNFLNEDRKDLREHSQCCGRLFAIIVAMGLNVGALGAAGYFFYVD